MHDPIRRPTVARTAAMAALLLTAGALSLIAAEPDARPADSVYPVTVPVGNPGNAADATGYGAVDYAYHIGKHEVTNDEFCAFLNAVARTDAHELYDPRMANDGDDDNYGGIRRFGASGNHSYSVREGMGDKPVVYVSWQTALRYANWLSNGKGEGDTETGPYTFNGNDVTLPDHAALAAGAKAVWVLPTEDEWYKAAYFDAKKGSSGGFWAYPGGSDSPSAANLNTGAPSTVGSASAASPCGAFDLGGNAWEYNELRRGDKVGLRGGSFYLNDHDGYTQSGTRYEVHSARWPNYGFRVAKLGGEAAK
jgi:formylglycine-generating enzyme required for sulfatase activity